MKKYEVETETIKACANMLSSSEWPPLFNRMLDPEEELAFQERVSKYEKILKLAIKNKELKVIPGQKKNEPMIEILEFYKWSKGKGITVFEDEDGIKREIARRKEIDEIIDFEQRHTKSSKRKIDEAKLKLLLKKPLWELPGGLMLLDGFNPYESYILNEKCVYSDEQLRWLYQCVFDAYEKGTLKLVPKEKMIIPHRRTVIYRIDPKALIKFVAEMDGELQLLSPAKRIKKIVKNTSEEINPKTKKSYLILIYTLVKTYHEEYNPQNARNHTTNDIFEEIDSVGLEMKHKTIKKRLDEAFEYAKQHAKKDKNK